MKDKNEIDNLFKGKLENREFEFKDSYWNAAEELIDAHGDKGTKATPFSFNWKIITLGMMVILVPLFLYISYSDSSEVASIEKSVPETLHEMETTDAMHIENEASAHGNQAQIKAESKGEIELQEALKKQTSTGITAEAKSSQQTQKNLSKSGIIVQDNKQEIASQEALEENTSTETITESGFQSAESKESIKTRNYYPGHKGGQ